MSQRECAGFNWPRASVRTGNPIAGGPRHFAASAGSAPPDWFGPPLLPSEARGVFHPANVAASVKVNPGLAGFAPGDLFAVAFREDEASCAVEVGVGQGLGASPIKSLPDVRRPDARCAKIGARDGIPHSFKVREYSGEPSPAVFACNLFANDR